VAVAEGLPGEVAVLCMDALTDLMRDLERYKYLSDSKNRELMVAWRERNDKSAWDELICANMPLVIAMAKKFLGYGIELEDMVQAGSIGLMIAARRFDLSKSNHFATYAFYWIKNIIRRDCIEKRFQIRLPSRWYYRHGRRGLTIEQHEAFERLTGLHRWEIERGAERERRRWEPQDKSEPASKTAERREEVAGLKRRMARVKFVNPRDAEILNRRANGERLEDIAKDFGITRERVRQLEARGLKALCHEYGVFEAKFTLGDLLCSGDKLMFNE
jgi:RNA polymerase sigma factor (sigma-70 family)